MKQRASRCRVFLLVVLMWGATLMLQACGGGGGNEPQSLTGVEDTSSDGPLPETCSDIAGPWQVTEDVTITCEIGEERLDDSFHTTGEIILAQEGCAVSYVVPDFEVTRSGVIDGDRVRFSGPATIEFEEANFTQNSLDVEGEVAGDTMNLTGTGRAEGTINGDGFVCTGNSTAMLTRVDTGRVASSRQAQSTTTPVLLLDDTPLFFIAVQ